MSTTKKLGFDARFEVAYNYYNAYHGYFNAICGLIGVDHKMYDTEYWERYHVDIFRYLIEISYSENHWADKLIALVKNNKPNSKFTEAEKFMYWLIIHIYRVDGFTDFTELKRRFRKEYKLCKRSKL